MKKSLPNQIGMIFVIAMLAIACNKQQYSLPETSQEFGQVITYNNKVDVVLMVDNSSSMTQYQDKLALEVPGMLKSLNALGMDYHIVVVTTDMRSGGSGGMFLGTPAVLSSSSPNLATVLSARVRVGQTGSDLERGLESIRTVLSPNYLSGPGAGFLRSDALLAIVALSNEDDYSSGSVAELTTFFETLKPKFKGVTQAWMVNFIGVPNLQSSCSTVVGGGYKEPGLRWIELAKISGGQVEAICDSTLSKAVDNIRKRIVETLTDFRLDREPKLDTLSVKINGQVIAQSNDNGWEYIPEGHIIRFHGTAVPGADAKILIDFTPASAM